MDIELILAIIIGVVIGAAIIFFFFKRKPDASQEKLTEELQNQVNKIFPEALEKANKQLLTLANQQLKAEKQDIQTDLRNKKVQSKT